MSIRIDDDIIENTAILAKLSLNGREKEQAKEDMSRMLEYIDQLKELDTDGTEPLVHLFDTGNVFREDTVKEEGGSRGILANAPEVKDGMFKVPRTIE